ncbi:ROBO4 protein, partial [Eubucco bourcierii]|nr:ROBO4 protein [Eubucco bourcierii]
LPVPALRDNFRLQPGDLVATTGQVLELDCVPPLGHPEPRISWKKDGMALDLAGDRYVVTKGKLKVSPARRSDSGLYVCVAANAAGERQSRGAHVSVLGRREAVLQDLLAMRLHLDNITMMPTAAALLRWRMLTPVPALVSFMVLYRSLHPTSTSWLQHDAGRLLSTIIPQLRRGHQYEFKVRPYTGGTQGLDSNSRHLWIPEEVPSAAPQRVTVGRAETGNGSVVISWEPPPPEAHNGIIQGYKVWSMGEGWQPPTNRTVDGGTHHVEAQLPSPGVEFCVQVAAFNGAGLGVPSNATCSLLARRRGLKQWHGGDSGGTLTGLTAGSSGVVEVLRQPAVIAAAGSLLWLALLALLLLLCQRRASQDATAHHRLVAGDSPWLSGPWKPACAPGNLSSSSSLSSRLLGSDGRDPPPPRCAQRRGPDGDTGTALAAGEDPRRLPLFSSPKPRRGSLSLASGVTRSPVMPPRPPHAWHPPVTRTPRIHLWPPGAPRTQPWSLESRGTGPRPPGTAGTHPWSLRALGMCPWSPGTPGARPWSLRAPGMCPWSPGTSSWPPGTARTSLWSPGWPGTHQQGPSSQGACSCPAGTPRRVPWLPGTPRTCPWAPGTPGSILPRDMSLATRHPKDVSLTTRHPRDRSPVTGHISPALSDGVLTPQQVAEDLEMDQDTTYPRYPSPLWGTTMVAASPGASCVPHSPPAPTTPRSFSPLPTYGYIYGPPASELDEEEEEEEEEQEEEEQTATRGSPEGSLLNGWGSVSEDNFASARCSLVSSCDGSFLLDASFAQVLAVAVDGLCFGLED